uniref:RING-type domain-containing protein n=1 Tax=Ananas comosus var. bracteatus TaxID=296719 RepID=A0A6V7QKV6_ANACO|nr:unnamed protein product [Ananas comosus var. bracteatus]
MGAADALKKCEKELLPSLAQALTGSFASRRAQGKSKKKKKRKKKRRRDGNGVAAGVLYLDPPRSPGGGDWDGEAAAEPRPQPQELRQIELFLRRRRGQQALDAEFAGRAPVLRCRTKSATPTPPDSPRTQCDATAAAAVEADAVPSSRTPPASSNPKKGPVSALFQASSTPSSPRSPSRFALFKASLLLSRQSRCGICQQSVRSGHGSTAVFTAECSHAFHFPCISAHVRAQAHAHGGAALTCPACSAAWRQAPFSPPSRTRSRRGRARRSRGVGRGESGEPPETPEAAEQRQGRRGGGGGGEPESSSPELQGLRRRRAAAALQGEHEPGRAVQSHSRSRRRRRNRRR